MILPSWNVDTADTYLVIPSLPHRTKRDASHLIPTRARLKEDSHINYFNDMDIRLEAFEANQVVNFVTWTLTVDGNVRESILDHVYTTNPLSILNLNHNWLAFTDHGLIMFQISSKKSELEHSIRRDWCNYSKEKLGQALARHDWDFTSDSVQAYLDQLENQLVTIVDELVVGNYC